MKKEEWKQYGNYLREQGLDKPIRVQLPSRPEIQVPDMSDMFKKDPWWKHPIILLIIGGLITFTIEHGLPLVFDMII